MMMKLLSQMESRHDNEEQDHWPCVMVHALGIRVRELGDFVACLLDLFHSRV